MSNKIKIFWDVDDVVLNTSEVLVDMVHEKYGKSPNKTMQDIKDWELKSIYRDIEPYFIDWALQSPQFWNKVEIKKEFLQFLETGSAEQFEHYFVTVGTQNNIDIKQACLNSVIRQYLNTTDFLFIGFDEAFSKRIVPMAGGIQVDDNINNLANTDAKIKILLKNFIETDYNSFYNQRYFIENLYEVNCIAEVIQMLEFILQNPTLLQG